MPPPPPCRPVGRTRCPNHCRCWPCCSPPPSARRFCLFLPLLHFPLLLHFSLNCCVGSSIGSVILSSKHLKRDEVGKGGRMSNRKEAEVAGQTMQAKLDKGGRLNGRRKNLRHGGQNMSCSVCAKQVGVYQVPMNVSLMKGAMFVTRVFINKLLMLACSLAQSTFEGLV